MTWLDWHSQNSGWGWQKTLFWRDRWLNGLSVGDIVPLLLQLISIMVRNSRTVYAALWENRWTDDISGIPSPQGIDQRQQFKGLLHVAVGSLGTLLGEFNLRSALCCLGEFLLCPAAF